MGKVVGFYRRCREKRTRCESPNCPEPPCFKQFSDVYAGWKAGSVPALLLASVQVLRKGRIQGVSTTKRIGRPLLEEHTIAHQLPPILPDTVISSTRERLNLSQTAHRTCSRTCSQQVQGQVMGLPSLGPSSLKPPRERIL